MYIHHDIVTAAKVLNMLFAPRAPGNVLVFFRGFYFVFYLLLRMLTMSSFLLTYYKLHTAVTYRCYAYSRRLERIHLAQ